MLAQERVKRFRSTWTSELRLDFDCPISRNHVDENWQLKDHRKLALGSLSEDVQVSFGIGDGRRRDSAVDGGAGRYGSGWRGSGTVSCVSSCIIVVAIDVFVEGEGGKRVVVR